LFVITDNIFNMAHRVVHSLADRLVFTVKVGYANALRHTLYVFLFLRFDFLILGMLLFKYSQLRSYLGCGNAEEFEEVLLIEPCIIISFQINSGKFIFDLQSVSIPKSGFIWRN
jgi:hypothetical protein